MTLSTLPEKIGRFTKASPEQTKELKAIAAYSVNENLYLVVRDPVDATYLVKFQSIDEEGIIGTDECVENTDDLDEALEVLVDYISTHDTEEV